MDVQKAQDFANEQLVKWGLAQEGWVVAMSKRLKTTLGQCYDDSEKRIEINFQYVSLNDENLVYDTILHEIAHALAGIEDGHGEVWKMWCSRVGAKPQVKKKRSEIVLPKYRLHIKWDDGRLEPLKYMSYTRKSVKDKFLKGRRETKNRLVWLIV